MTLEEALSKAKPLADACLARGKPYARGYWEASEEDGTVWQVYYTEDWHHRYIPPSLNGKISPIIHACSKHGDGEGETRLILVFRQEDGLWHLQKAETRSEDERAIRLLETAVKEWNA